MGDRCVSGASGLPGEAALAEGRSEALSEMLPDDRDARHSPIRGVADQPELADGKFGELGAQGGVEHDRHEARGRLEGARDEDSADAGPGGGHLGGHRAAAEDDALLRNVEREKTSVREMREILGPADPRNVGEAPDLAEFLREGGRGVGDGARRSDLGREEISTRGAHAAQGEVGLATREIGVAHARIDDDPERRMAREQRRKNRNEQIVCDAGSRRDAHGALGRGFDAGAHASERRRRALEVLGEGHELLGGRGCSHSVRAAVEEMQVERRLERIEATSHGRGIDPESSRRFLQRSLTMEHEQDPRVVPAELREIDALRHGSAFLHLGSAFLGVPLRMRNGQIESVENPRRNAMAQQESPSIPRAPLHVVVGAGQVGPLVARELVRRGVRVRMVRRSAVDPGISGAEVARADALDADAMDAALDGAAVVYDCTNPARYDAWSTDLLPLRRGVRDAAMRAGARLVALDCLYMLGRGTGAPRREDDPLAPCSKKGELRAELHRELEAMGRRGDLRFVVGRASDFFGPGADQGSLFSLEALRGIAAGKSVIAPTSADVKHAYSFVPDVADGLVRLGLDDDADGVFHLPVASKGTTRELALALGQAAGTTPTVREIPRWVFRAAGLFVPTLGAMVEMLYQWEAPFELDDTKFCARYGVQATPLEDAARATMAQVVDVFRNRPGAAVPSAKPRAAS